MRENWNRATDLLEFSRSELDRLVSAALPDQRVLHSTYTQGGLANTNIHVTLSNYDQELLLRVFVRDPDQAQKEYKIQELVSERVPSPRILYFSSSNPVTGHPYLLREWTEGSRLEEVSSTLNSQDLMQLARSLGETLAGIHSFTFPRAGFFDSELNVETPVDLGSAGLIEYARKCLIDECGRDRLGVELSDELLRFVEREAVLLDDWDGNPSLTHSDFGGSNILVRQSSTNWNVVAVLDWEFAFSGAPFFDFGNLLRDPLGSMSGFEDAVGEGYTSAGGRLPKAWRQMSLLTDLTAWLEFLTRPNVGSGVVATARSVVSTTIANWNL